MTGLPGIRPNGVGCLAFFCPDKLFVIVVPLSIRFRHPAVPFHSFRCNPRAPLDPCVGVIVTCLPSCYA